LEDESAVRERHGKHFLTLLKDSETTLKGAEQLSAILKISDEFGNIQSAWEWGVQNNAFQLLISTLPSVWLSYDMRGWLIAGFTQTDSLIQQLRPLAEPAELKVALGLTLAFHGMFCFRMGDYARAKSSLDESLSMLRRLNIPKPMMPALIFSGIVTSLMGDVTTAQAKMNEGVAIARQLGDMWFLALGQFNQGFQLGLQGKRESAYELMQAGLQLWREMGNARFSAMALNFISPIAIELNLRAEAQNYLEESLKLTSALKDRWGMGTALGQLGSLNLIEGELSTGETQLQQSIAIFTELGALWDLAWATTQVGKLYLKNSEFEKASEFLAQAVSLAEKANVIPLAMEARVELAECFLKMNRKEEAIQLATVASENPLTGKVVREKADKVISKM